MFFTDSCKVTSFKVELQSRTLVHSSLVKMPLKRPHKSLALSKVSGGAWTNTFNLLCLCLTVIVLTAMLEKSKPKLASRPKQLSLKMKLIESERKTNLFLKIWRYMYLVFFDPQLPVDDDLLGYFPTVVNRVSKLLFIIFEVKLKIWYL